MSVYTVEDDENYVLVEGSLREDSQVTVKYNNKKYVFRREDGKFSEGACTAELYLEDGSYIKEGAVTQEIRLPDGSKIRTGAVERSLKLPNGEKIEDKPLAQKRNNSSSFVNDSSGSVSILLSSSSQVNDSNTTGESNKEEKQIEENTSPKSDDIVTKKELIESAIPGFFTIVLIGVGLADGSTIALISGILLYCAYFVPSLVGYLAQNVFLDENDPEKDSMSEVDKLKQKYKNDEITESVFEDELEDIIDQDEELKVENTYN